MSGSIRFIHTADIHLGSPIRGFGSLSDEWAARLQTAIPEAFDRVIETALTREVDFVVFAGDLVDKSSASYCDYLRFFEGLDKLHAAGIPSYLIAGNHDPYTSWARNISRLPESAHMLGVYVPTFELYERDGEPLCLIGGRSYYSEAWPFDIGVADGITRENAIGALSEAHPNAAEAPFSIGIIHTGFEIDASKAVVSEDFLLAQDIDYWACGHLHRQLVRPIADDPRVVFPGGVQGRALKEFGQHGCYLVELEEGVSPRLEFVPTASVAFHSIDVDVSECRTLSDVKRVVKEALFRESSHDYCGDMVAHVNLVGETDLHAYLRKPDVVAGLQKRVNDACPSFFCDAIVDGTRFPAADGAIATPTLEQESDSALIDYVQSTLVQRGIAVPDVLTRLIGDFRVAAETLASDLLDERGDGLDKEAAREEVARRIADYVEKRKPSEVSVFQLGDKLEAEYIEVRRATERAAAIRQEDRELRELSSKKKDMVARERKLTDEVEDLTAWRDQMQTIDENLEIRRNELARLRDSAAELTVLVKNEEAVDPRLLGMTTQDDRLLRDKLEEYAVEREKLNRAVEDAKQHSDASSAAYEALLEMDEDDNRIAKRKARATQVIVAVLLTIEFVLAGLYSFMHGREIASLSFTGFGIGMVVLGFFLAVAIIVVLLRSNTNVDSLENRRQDAQWVMLQDKKLLNARMAEKDALEAELAALRERSGLGSSDGSIKQSLMLLDDAQEARARMAEQRNRAMAQEMHESAANQAIVELEAQRRTIEEAAGLEPDAPVRAIESMLRAKEEERDELQTELESANTRIEELASKLDKVKDDRSFDSLKLDYHQIRARLRVAKHDYITLLIAQRLLEE